MGRADTWGAEWLRQRKSETNTRSRALPLLAQVVDLVEQHGAPELRASPHLAGDDSPVARTVAALRAAAAAVRADPGEAPVLGSCDGTRHYLGFSLASERLQAEIGASPVDGRARYRAHPPVAQGDAIAGWMALREGALELLLAVAEAPGAGQAVLAADGAALLAHVMWVLQLAPPAKPGCPGGLAASHARAIVRAAADADVAAATKEVALVETCWRPRAGPELLAAPLRDALLRRGLPLPKGPSASDGGVPAAFAAAVRSLFAACVASWHTACARSFPAHMAAVDTTTQRAHARHLRRLNACSYTLMAAFPSVLGSPSRRAAKGSRFIRAAARVRAACRFRTLGRRGALARVRRANRDVAAVVMSCPPAFVEEMVQGAVFAETVRFSELARRNDPELLSDAEFQAGRNVWAALGLQLVVQRRKADVTPAVVGYSMLYPYTDNLLDDPSITANDKLECQARFRRRLAATHSAGDEEWAKMRTDAIRAFEQVSFVEQVWPRARHPRTYRSLLAIHDAQTRSLGVQGDASAVTNRELLEVTVDKGGTSVLADAFMVAGDGCSRALAAFAFALGVGLQVVDDLQDVQEDCAARQHTLFTGPFSHRGAGGYADEGARRLCCFLEDAVLAGTPRGGAAWTQVHAQPNGALDVNDRSMRLWMLRMTRTMVLKAVARAPDVFSESLRKDAAARAPLPWSQMPKIRGMRTLLRLVRAGLI